MSKKEIVSYNKEQARIGGYQILRYKNSDGNEMAKMLFGFDHIIEGKTDTAILVEGAMDVVNLSQELGLFESDRMRAVATFGKKLSSEQIYHLQSKGIKNIIIFFDDDAIDDIKRMDAHKFFNVRIASTMDADGVEQNEMRLIYSVSKCLDILEQDMTQEDAMEYFTYNVSGAYVGGKTPIWCWDNF